MFVSPYLHIVDAYCEVRQVGLEPTLDNIVAYISVILSGFVRLCSQKNGNIIFSTQHQQTYVSLYKSHSVA